MAGQPRASAWLEDEERRERIVARRRGGSCWPQGRAEAPGLPPEALGQRPPQWVARAAGGGGRSMDGSWRPSNSKPPLPGNSLSASDMMMLGLFPPSSRVTLLRLLLPAATWICWPTCKEGGKDELSGEEKGPNAPRHRAEDPATGGLK